MKRTLNPLLYTILSIVGYIFGILYCITLIGAIIGIPLIIGAGKYKEWSKMTYEEIAPYKDNVVIWGIVFVIFTFPAGLIALITIINFEGQLEDYNDKRIEKTAEMVKEKMQETNSFESKADKLKKFHQLYQDGIITEEDYKIAKDKILNE